MSIPYFDCFLILFIFSLNSFVIVHDVDASEISINSSIFDKIQDVEGEYQGEVRLQSADGLINRLISSAQVSLKISGDELILKTSADLLGPRCGSEIGGIRELFKFSPGEAQILKAEFDFKGSTCFSQAQLDNLFALIERDNTGALTLETLLVHSPPGTALKTSSPGKLNFHGYFTKVLNRS